MDQITQPSPSEIKSQRLAAGLTQTQAAKLVHASLKTWQNWESETGEARKMPLAPWELFLIKTNQTTGLRYSYTAKIY